MAVDLDVEFVLGLAKKYPEKFSRQQRTQWKKRESYPSLPNLLWLVNKSGVRDVGLFFKQSQHEPFVLSEKSP